MPAFEVGTVVPSPIANALSKPLIRSVSLSVNRKQICVHVAGRLVRDVGSLLQKWKIQRKTVLNRFPPWRHDGCGSE